MAGLFFVVGSLNGNLSFKSNLHHPQTLQKVDINNMNVVILNRYWFLGGEQNT